MNNQNQWKTMASNKRLFDLSATWTIPPISIGSSIWFVQNIWIDETTVGLVEYLPKPDILAPLIHFPEAFRDVDGNDEYRLIVPQKYKDDCILVLGSHLKGRLACRLGATVGAVMFDPKSREYSDVFKLSVEENLIDGLSCVAIGDFIHFFRGRTDTICSVKERTLRSFRGSGHRKLDVSRWYSPVVKTNDCYQSSNKMLISGFVRTQCENHMSSDIVDLIFMFGKFEIFKFGGVNVGQSPWRSLDSFYIGTLKNGNPAEPVSWRFAPE